MEILKNLKNLEDKLLPLTEEGQVTPESVRKRIERGFKRRDGEIIAETFQLFAKRPDGTDDKPTIAEDNLKECLSTLGVFLKEDELGKFFDTMDINGNGALSFNEFERAVKASTPVSSWVRSLSVEDIIVNALPCSIFLGKIHPLRAVSLLSDVEVKVISHQCAIGIQTLLMKSIDILKKSFETMEKNSETKKSNAENKFEVIQEMNCGSIEDFHEGIEKRIGSADLEFKKAMKHEHCDSKGAEDEFESLNYKIKTTPQQEWNLVVNKLELPLEHSGHGRKIPDINDLLKMELSTKSQLQIEEVMAVVLYTGPMYFLYNVALRQWPLDKFKALKDKNSLFPTTIFVLVSAVKKIARVMMLPLDLKLYRGLGGSVAFPKSFFKVDKTGCRGFAEWGFMSTTANREVALQYSGVKEQKALPTVLEIRVGAVDRGACIRDYSQYANEVEYLWVPGSFLEPEGDPYVEVTPYGIVHIVPVQVNANLKGDTTEELLGRKRKMHLAAFRYRLLEVQSDLEKRANKDDAAKKRLDADHTKGQYTVKAFVEKIVQQCEEVLERHKNVKAEKYLDDNVYRSLVFEMVDVKAMALSKLEEWLQNEQTSFIGYRFTAALRTVQRRYIAFKSQFLDKATSPEVYLDLCKLRGLVIEKVEEVNELQESRLQAGSAEGKSPADLELLVQAGADVNKRRPDGVTAVWLAAQFGYDDCIRKLVALKADVNSPANNKATPVYTAAQSGYPHIIELLVELRADLDYADDKGLTPMHQAAMNGHLSCIEMLLKKGAKYNLEDQKGQKPIDSTKCSQCRAKLEAHANVEQINLDQPMTASMRTRERLRKGNLIISSGDISDVDGFLALAEYAKTGADLVFVMNYPAYLGEKDDDPDFHIKNPGLGYKYTSKQLYQVEEKFKTPEYTALIERYQDIADANERMRATMTDLAFQMVTRVWTDDNPAAAGVAKGRCFFCVGGINSVNPFAQGAIKNELLVYAKAVDGVVKLSPREEGTVFDPSGKVIPGGLELEKYADIYMDFNGSMAFFGPGSWWRQKLSDPLIAKKVHGVVIMGGVQSNTPPTTIPATPNILNRFSSATMNQLYHPNNTGAFLQWLADHATDIPIFSVTNNAVHDLATNKAGVKTPDGVPRFLESNGLQGPFLKSLAQAHYESHYNPPRKAYDLYSAFALRKLMEQGLNPLPPAPGQEAQGLMELQTRRMYFSDKFGLTLVSDEETWESTREQYLRQIDVEEKPDDTPFVRNRKENFRNEIEIMRTFELLPYVTVRDLIFKLGDDDKKLELDFVSSKTS